MDIIFIPGIKFINRLKYPQKFGLIALLLSIFIIVLLFLFAWAMNREIDFIKKERIGVEYIDLMENLLQNVERHRGLVNGYLYGIKNLKNEMGEVNSTIDKKIAEINKLNVKYNNIFNSLKNFKTITQKWNELKDNSLSLTPQKSFQEHTDVINMLLNLIGDIGDNSNITLDAKVDTFYLGQSLVYVLPELTEGVGRLRGIGIGVVAKKQINNEEKKDMILQSAFVEQKKVEISRNLNKIYNANPALVKKLKNFHLDFEESVEEFLDFAEKEIIDAKTIFLDPEEFFELGTGAVRSAFRLYDVEILLFDELLEKRIKNLEGIRLLIILPTVFVLIGIIYIFSCFSLSVVKSVNYLKEKAMKVAEGDLKIKSELNTNDELRNLSDSMNAMIHNLRTLINREETTKNIILNAIESRTTEKTIKEIVTDTGIIFKADRCVFIEYDFETETYLPIKHYNTYISSLEVNDLVGLELPIEEFKAVSDFIFSRQKAFVVSDVNKLKLPEKSKKLLEGVEIQSVLVAPVFYASTPIGFLSIDMVKGLREFKQEEIDLLESIAGQIAILLNQSRLKEEIFRLNEELKSSLETEKILRTITSEVSKLNTHAEIDDYVSEQLLNIFDIDKVCHFHVEKDYINWCIRKIKGELLKELHENCFTQIEVFDELIQNHKNMIIVNDVDLNIKNEGLKTCLKNAGIHSFIAYSAFQEITMIASEGKKIWSEDKMNLFKLIMDTISIINLEIMRKEELEDTRKIFIATLAHDLRSPLFAEQKALEYLLSPQFEIKKELYTEYLQEMYKTNEEILKLVNNLMTVYHYETGKPELNKTSENIEQLIKETVQSIKFLAEDSECEILYDIQEKLPMVSIDKTEVNRALMNLITNAIKHNPRGTKIYVGAKRVDGYVQVSVKDNGPGLSEEIKSEIFQRYPLKKRKIGTGLGLYITKQVVEAHNGKIWFETGKGKGTTFIFTLPL